MRKQEVVIKRDYLDSGQLILAVNSSGIGLNVIAGDQYVAIVLPARTFRGEFERRGIAPQVLSRAVEDSGTVTSPTCDGCRFTAARGRGPGRPRRLC